MLKKYGISFVKPYKFSSWHVGFCYFTGLYENKKVFIKACTGKYDTIESESKMGRVVNRHIPRVLLNNQVGIKFVVTEFVEVGSVISSQTSENLIEQSIEILDILYEYGIINRDVNPENLYMDKNNTLVLIDYGWAVFLDDMFRKTDYQNIESMLNVEYRNNDGSFDDAYSFYKVLNEYYGIDASLLNEIKKRVGRLRVL